jgi:hypothetical protein
MNRRDHWTVRRSRFDRQAAAVFACWPRKNGSVVVPMMPCVVTLTRIGPRELDSDNLAGGFKAVRDQVAICLGVDDGDERVRWVYRQERGRPREYAIRVRVENAGSPSED